MDPAVGALLAPAARVLSLFHDTRHANCPRDGASPRAAHAAAGRLPEELCAAVGLRGTSSRTRARGRWHITGALHRRFPRSCTAWPTPTTPQPVPAALRMCGREELGRAEPPAARSRRSRHGPGALPGPVAGYNAPRRRSVRSWRALTHWPTGTALPAAKQKLHSSRKAVEDVREVVRDGPLPDFHLDLTFLNSLFQPKRSAPSFRLPCGSLMIVVVTAGCVWSARSRFQWPIRSRAMSWCRFCGASLPTHTRQPARLRIHSHPDRRVPTQRTELPRATQAGQRGSGGGRRRGRRAR